MLRLLLLRHCKAAREAGGGDKDRPLTKRGREDAARLGLYLRDQKLIPNLAVASDARRTRETLGCVAEAMKAHCKIIYDPDLYLAEDSTLKYEMHKAPDVVQTMLVVAHNPGVAEFALRMAGSGDQAARLRMEMKYPTGGLTVLDFATSAWSSIQWGDGTLDRFVTPSMLSQDAEDTD
jgi:phosphohistidine phosphatase